MFFSPRSVCVYVSLCKIVELEADDELIVAGSTGTEAARTATFYQ